MNMEKSIVKKTMLGLCLTLTTGAFAAETVFERNGVTLTDEEIAAIATDLSEYELEDMRKNKAILRTFIEQLFDNKVMAAAIVEALKDDKSHAVIRDMSLAKFNNHYYIKKKAIEKIHAVKDFKTLAKQTYQSQIKKYQKPQTANYYHILFIKQDDVDSKAKAERVLSEIKDGQLTLAEAAKHYHTSIAGTNADGVLEKVDETKLMKPIQKAVSGMKVGDISEIIETGVGYHIVGLKDINPIETQPYNAQVEEQIITNLKTQIYRSVENEIRNQYRGPEGLTVNEKLLESTVDAILFPEKK